LQIAAEAKQFPLVEAFKQQKPVFMVGSSWEPDEAVVATFWQDEALHNSWKLIIAPHEITESHLVQLEAKFGGQCVRYSNFNPANHLEYTVLIIDNIGMLSALYRYADLAYIGGGFGSGIHNILEPMAFGLPVIFGPKYQKFTEAVTLLELGGAKTIQSSTELIQAFRYFTNPTSKAKASAAVSNYMQQNRGATVKIMSRLKEQFPHLFNP
jgi:3-deoxy-D-manno-octulosonic-acid transferase